MTVLIGLLCSNGAVLGADRAVTHTDSSKMPVAEGELQKITVFEGGRAAVAISGNVGGGQLVVDSLRKFSDETAGGASKSRTEAVALDTIREALQQRSNDYLRAFKELGFQGLPASEWIKDASKKVIGSGIYIRGVGSGGKCRPCVVTFDGGYEVEHLQDGVPFSAAGTGSHFAIPYMLMLRELLFLKVLPDVDQGMKAVYWALDATIRARAGFGVGQGIDLAVLQATMDGSFRVRLLVQGELEALAVIQSEINKKIGIAFQEAVKDSKIPAAPTEDEALKGIAAK